MRGAQAESTVIVDGQVQHVFWRHSASRGCRGRMTRCSEDHPVSDHEGYRRLPRPVLYRRRIQREGIGAWEVLDRIDGQPEHDFALRWRPSAPQARGTMLEMRRP